MTQSSEDISGRIETRRKLIETAKMKNRIRYRFMKPGEEDLVIELVLNTFNEFIAPVYSAEGIAAFSRYISIENLRSRGRSNHEMLVAELDRKIIGVMEIRDKRHISLFFVFGKMQKKSIGKNLLRHAMECCFTKQSDLKKITVNASFNAAEAYQRMGFVAEGKERSVNGIRVIPMSLPF
jgi:predicted GNAT family N-acyltransferase